MTNEKANDKVRYIRNLLTKNADRRNPMSAKHLVRLAIKELDEIFELMNPKVDAKTQKLNEEFDKLWNEAMEATEHNKIPLDRLQIFLDAGLKAEGICIVCGEVKWISEKNGIFHCDCGQKWGRI